MLNDYFPLLITGVIAIFIGLLLITLSFFTQSLGKNKKKSEAGGVIIIGPIPIVFGTNKSIAVTAAIVGGLLTALAIILTFLLGWGHL